MQRKPPNRDDYTNFAPETYGEASGAPPFPGAPNGRVTSENGHAPAQGERWAESPQRWPEPDETPPWERDSGRLPAPQRKALDADNPTTSPMWDLGPAVEQSFPGVRVSDMSGTGKTPAVVPLNVGDSAWSRGVRAPTGRPAREAPALAPQTRGGAYAGPGATPGGLEIDEQPSAQIRALSAGNLARTTAIVTVALLLSRVLGLLRTSLFAGVFGTTPDADAFTYAFTLPDAVFTIVAGGALASAFIPVFTDYLITKRDRKTAWHIASSAINISFAALTLFAAVVFVLAPQILGVMLHDTFVQRPAEAGVIVELTRIMLLQPIFLGAATIAVSILQARQYFVLPAVGQVIYTVSLIGGILATSLDKRTGIFGGHLGILGPTWGVVAGAALQLLIQIPGLARAKMAYRLSFDITHPGVRQIFRLMAPRLFNSVMLFVSVFVNRALLDTVSAQDNGVAYGYVTAFTLVMVPVGVLGMAVSQAAFPTLAALVSTGAWDKLRATIERTLRGVIFLGVPASLGLIALATPVSRLMVAHGNFPPSKIPLVANPLIFFAIGLLGLALIEILTRSFYALHDSRTPVQVSVLQFMFVIGLSVVLLQPLGAGGLALATALGSLGEALVLLALLSPRLGGLDLKRLGGFTLNALVAGIVCALTAYLVYTLAVLILPIDGLHPSIETFYMFGRVLVAIGVATGAFFIFARFLRIDDAMPLDRLVKRILRR